VNAKVRQVSTKGFAASPTRHQVALQRDLHEEEEKRTEQMDKAQEATQKQSNNLVRELVVRKEKVEEDRDLDKMYRDAQLNDYYH